MDTLGDVKQRTRSLIGDPDGDFATDAYIVPIINQAHDVAFHRLESTCAPFIEQYVVIPNVQQGVTTLQPFQAKDGLLYNLINPIQIEMKQAGAPDSAYREMPTRRILPSMSPNQAPPTSMSMWTWRSYVLTLTPLPFNCDLRILGEFKPKPLTEDDDLIVLHPSMTAQLAFGTAALVGAERGNSNYQESYGPQADMLLTDISAELVRQEQGTSARVGRANRSNGRRFRGSW
jgi:hypothetical protein